MRWSRHRPPQRRSLSLPPVPASSPISCAPRWRAPRAGASPGSGRSRACPFDLHALLPVPADLLRRGPDDPAALAWLWTHWGTTEALRHVAPITDGVPDEPPRRRRARRRSASPSGRPTGRRGGRWRSSPTRWPALRFTLQPRYDAA